jgi:acetoin:2,6-dichlorophenolindophenol oxidoreductase subunit beta
VPPMRMNEAIRHALATEMRIDPRVIVLGEDVGAAGGVFKATDGLLEEFGPMRVRDTPISEAAILGAAVGAAMAGLRPVAEMMFVEFFGVALDQATTQAAKMHFLSGGQFDVPLVVRASAGAGLGFGAQHSQTLETWFMSTPGLKVASPSGAASAYRVIRSAIRDPNPVVVIEPRALYGSREDVDFAALAPDGLGKARRVREGSDVTLVALGQMVRVATKAAEQLATRWSAEVLDLETVVPWDREAVEESVSRTGRLIIVEESPRTGGWGADVVAHIASQLWSALKAPPVRLTCPDAPVPFSAELERRYLPTPEVVAHQVDALCDDGRVCAPWWEEWT